MTYDLLIKGGHVLDPGQGLDDVRDIAITGGKIARIATDIPAQDAARVLAQRLVTHVVDLVLDPPVIADDRQQPARIGAFTGE